MKKDPFDHLMQQLFNGVPGARLSDPRHEALRNEVEGAISTLEPMQAIVLRLRYGLIGKSPLSIKEVAFGMNLGEESIQELEFAALQKLREVCSTRKIERYLVRQANQPE